MDYADISAAFKPIWRKLDHFYLMTFRLEKSNERMPRRVDFEAAQAQILPLLTEVVVAETLPVSLCLSRRRPMTKARLGPTLLYPLFFLSGAAGWDTSWSWTRLFTAGLGPTTWRRCSA
jgi:hypothetical protein